MKVTRRTVLLASGAVLSREVLLGCKQRSGTKPATPESTLEIFNAAIKRWDTQALARCVVQGAPFELKNQGPIRKGPVLELSSPQVVFDGDRATVTVTVRVLSDGDINPITKLIIVPIHPREGYIEGKPITETLAFEKEGEQWKIFASDQGNRGYLNYCATLSRYAAQANRKALEYSCLSNIRQLGTAMAMFLQDHQEQFTLKPESYEAAIWDYVKNEKLFHCPCSDPSSLRSYAFNPALAGLYSRQLPTPSKTVLLYEGTRAGLEFRHEGRAGVVFVKGSAKMVTQSEARALIWRP